MKMCALEVSGGPVENEARELSAHVSLLRCLRAVCVRLAAAAQVTHRHISWAAAATLKDCLEQDFRVMQVRWVGG